VVVTGTATYRQRIALLREAVVQVRSKTAGIWSVCATREHLLEAH
jgi:hypothetical protein